MPMFKTVSIIPGIENLAPERTLTSSGSAGSPSWRPMACSIRRRCSSTSAASPPRDAAVAQEITTRLGGDGETGRHGEADVGHLGKIGPLAAQQVLQILIAFAECV